MSFESIFNRATSGLMRKRISEGKVAGVSRPTFFSCLATCLALLGCESRESLVSLDQMLRTGIESQPAIFALKGIVLSTHDEAPFKVLDLKLNGNAIISSELVIHLLYYKKTATFKLPTSALILVERNKNGMLEILGRDAERSIFENSPENVARITEKLENRDVLPSRDLRLPRHSAMEIANKELSIHSSREYRIVATRMAFGWKISYRSKKEPILGDEATVVIGDDKTVIADHRGY